MHKKINKLVNTIKKIEIPSRPRRNTKENVGNTLK